MFKLRIVLDLIYGETLSIDDTNALAESVHQTAMATIHTDKEYINKFVYGFDTVLQNIGIPAELRRTYTTWFTAIWRLPNKLIMHLHKTTFKSTSAKHLPILDGLTL